MEHAAEKLLVIARKGILERIFSFLPVELLSFVRLTCSSWESILRKSHPQHTPMERQGTAAVRRGYTNCTKLLLQNGFKPTELMLDDAARAGNLELMVCLQPACGEINWHYLAYSAANGLSYDCLKYTQQQKTAFSFGKKDEERGEQEERHDMNEIQLCEYAAARGRLDALKYAHENGCHWDGGTCYYAALNGQMECLKYAIENGCECDEAIRLFVDEHGYQLGVKLTRLLKEVAEREEKWLNYPRVRHLWREHEYGQSYEEFNEPLGQQINQIDSGTIKLEKELLQQQLILTQEEADASRDELTRLQQQNGRIQSKIAVKDHEIQEIAKRPLETQALQSELWGWQQSSLPEPILQKKRKLPRSHTMHSFVYTTTTDVSKRCSTCNRVFEGFLTQAFRCDICIDLVHLQCLNEAIHHLCEAKVNRLKMLSGPTYVNQDLIDKVEAEIHDELPRIHAMLQSYTTPGDATLLYSNITQVQKYNSSMKGTIIACVANTESGEMVSIKRMNITQATSLLQKSVDHLKAEAKRIEEDRAYELLDEAYVNVNALLEELDILKTIQHKNLRRFHGCHIVNDELWVVMEYIGEESLRGVMDRFTRVQLTEAEIAYVCSQILHLLSYLHASGRIHRYIMSYKIVLSNGRVIIDNIDDAGLVTQQSKRDVEPHWIAPELLKGHLESNKVDIWSLGILVREMLQGKPPFIFANETEPDYQQMKLVDPIFYKKYCRVMKKIYGESFEEDFHPDEMRNICVRELEELTYNRLLDDKQRDKVAKFMQEERAKIFTKEMPPLKSFFGKYSPELLDFDRMCLNADPTKRASAVELLQHPFLLKACTQHEFANAYNAEHRTQNTGFKLFFIQLFCQRKLG